MDPADDHRPDGPDGGPPLILVRTARARARMQVPELERLLSSPIGARISDNFDSLHVRLRKAVDRLREEALAAANEAGRRSRIAAAAAIVLIVLSAVAMRAAFGIAASARLLSAAAVLVPVMAATWLWLKYWAFRRDRRALQAFAARFDRALAEARTPADLHRLAEQIRADAAAVRGEPPPSTGPGQGDGTGLKK